MIYLGRRPRKHPVEEPLFGPLAFGSTGPRRYTSKKSGFDFFGGCPQENIESLHCTFVCREVGFDVPFKAFISFRDKIPVQGRICGGKGQSNCRSTTTEGKSIQKLFVVMSLPPRLELVGIAISFDGYIGWSFGKGGIIWMFECQWKPFRLPIKNATIFCQQEEATTTTATTKNKNNKNKNMTTNQKNFFFNLRVSLCRQCRPQLRGSDRRGVSCPNSRDRWLM